MSSASSSRVVPETKAGWLRIASAISASGPDVATASARKARARPISDVDSSGAPQPSIADDLDRLAGELGERLGDRDLQRVGRVEVVVGRPAVEHAGREHRGVLARAVHLDRALAAAVADHRLAGRRRRAGSRAGSAGSPPTGLRRPGSGVRRRGGRARRSARRRRGRAGPAAARAPRAPSPAPGSACCRSAGGSAPRPCRPTTRPRRPRRARPPIRSGGPPRSPNGRSRPRPLVLDMVQASGTPTGRIDPVSITPALPHAPRARRPRAASPPGALASADRLQRARQRR